VRLDFVVLPCHGMAMVGGVLILTPVRSSTTALASRPLPHSWSHGVARYPVLERARLDATKNDVCARRTRKRSTPQKRRLMNLEKVPSLTVSIFRMTNIGKVHDAVDHDRQPEFTSRCWVDDNVEEGECENSSRLCEVNPAVNLDVLKILGILYDHGRLWS